MSFVDRCAFRCRARRNKRSPPAASATTAAATPMPIPTPAAVLRPLLSLEEVLLNAEAADVEELALGSGVDVDVDVMAAMSEGAMEVAGDVALLADQVCGFAFGALMMVKFGELEAAAVLG